MLSRVVKRPDGQPEAIEAKEYWVVWWKKNKGNTPLEMIRTFGVSDSYEEAAEKIVERAAMDVDFRRKFYDGVFLPLDINKGLWLRSLFPPPGV